MSNIENRVEEVEEIINVEKFVRDALTPVELEGKMYDTLHGFKSSGFDDLDSDEYEDDYEEKDCDEEEDDIDDDNFPKCVNEFNIMINYDEENNKWYACDDSGLSEEGNTIGELIKNVDETIRFFNNDFWHGKFEYWLENPEDCWNVDEMEDFMLNFCIRFLIEE